MKADGNDKIFYKQLKANEERLEMKKAAKQKQMMATENTGNVFYFSEREMEIDDIQELLNSLSLFIDKYQRAFEIE